MRDKAFDEIRACNTHYWNSLTKLGRILSGHPQGDSLASTLQGLSVVEDMSSSKVVRSCSPSGITASSQGRIHDFAFNQFKSYGLRYKIHPLRSSVSLRRLERNAQSLRSK